MSLSAAVSGFVVFLLSVSGTVTFTAFKEGIWTFAWSSCVLSTFTCCKLRIFWVFRTFPFSSCLMCCKVEPGCRSSSSCGGRLVCICSYFHHSEVFWRDFVLTVKPPKLTVLVVYDGTSAPLPASSVSAVWPQCDVSMLYADSLSWHHSCLKQFDTSVFCFYFCSFHTYLSSILTTEWTERSDQEQHRL